MSDSESSNSDLFFDAEDTALNGQNAAAGATSAPGGSAKPDSDPRQASQSQKGGKIEAGPTSVTSILNSPMVENQIEILTGDQLSARDQRWSRLERLRRRDEDEEGLDVEGEIPYQNQPSCDSTESSVEGIYLTGVRSLHPFKVVESDSRSVQSDVKSLARSSVSGYDIDGKNKGATHEDGLQSQLNRDSSTGDVSEAIVAVDNTIVEASTCASEPRAEAQKVVGSSSSPQEKPSWEKSEDASVKHVPDIVSSTKLPAPGQSISTEAGKGVAIAALPSAPPRKKKSVETKGKASSADNLSRQSSRESDHETRAQLSGSSNQTFAAPQPPPIDSKVGSSSAEGSCRPRSLVVNTPATPPLSGRRLRAGSPPALPSPHTTVDSLTRDLEQSLMLSPSHPDYNLDKYSGLNISLACRGDFVVKPQDDDKTKGQAWLMDKSSVQPVCEASQVCANPEPEELVGGPGGGSKPPGFHQVGGSLDRRPTTPDMKRSSLRSNRAMVGGSGGRRSDGHLSGGSGGHHSGGSGGHHSGGSGGHHSGRSTAASFKGGSGGSDRRSIGSGGSADASGIVKQLGLSVRLKSDSGKKLSDYEILQQIKVKNLDTGLEMDLATAEKQLPQSINPLSLHIMRLTSEYSGTQPESEITSMDSDTESAISGKSDFEIGEGKRRRTMTKFLGGMVKVKKSATKAAKVISSEVTRRQLKREDTVEEKLGTLSTDISTTDGVQVSNKDGAKAAAGFKRIQAHKSGPYDFENVQFGQDLSGHHTGPIWCMKFSLCGRLLATAGQDFILRIWVLQDKHGHFINMRRRYQLEKEGIADHQDDPTQDQLNTEDTQGHIFMNRPFVTYMGHTSDLLDISWSKNFFILTSSMDKTVRLWHISRKECLCVFQHIDFVTAIAFHPRNDQFFLSGSLDGKLRLWNIPDKKVALWNEVDGSTKLITAANFCQNGKFACVGTYDGRVIFYSTDQLKYHTTIHVRSSRGKNSIGRKVTGIEPHPGEDKILVTSTDSRIRLYDLRDLSLVCKYKGYINLSSQIRACFSPDGKYICAGSENHCVFLWSTHHHSSNLTARKDKNNYYEAIRAHSAAVTCTLFAPVPELIFEAVQRGREAAGKARGDGDLTGNEVGSKSLTGYVVISGDYDGDIKVFIKEGKRSSLPR